MKRKNHLYEDTYNINNIIHAYNEVCHNTKNKRKVKKYKDYKSIYISRIYDTLSNKKYIIGPYNVFTIFEPKKRRIVSQNMHDKVINHLVSRHILYPALMPCLIDANVASRKNLGTKKGIDLAISYRNKCDINFKKYYILKFDISKFFYSIDHNILKSKQYLKYCLEEISKFLKKEKLSLNPKTRIYSPLTLPLFTLRTPKFELPVFVLT